MREKLIELLGADVCGHDCCGDCEHKVSMDACIAFLKENMADHIIANDVVPVVRCKDCKNWRWSKNNLFGEDYGTCVECLMDTRKEHFCSYGERKDNERKTD